jgi:hypothetical protein
LRLLMVDIETIKYDHVSTVEIVNCVRAIQQTI